jgi:hypothetical protein
VSTVVKSTSFLVSCLTPFIFGLPGPPKAVRAESLEPGKIEIRIYDFAGVTPKNLEEAERG